MHWRSQIVTLIIAITLAGYLLISSHKNDSLSELETHAQSGYYLNQATVIETGRDGNTRIKLQADRVVQNTENDSINMQQVKVNFHSEDGTPWILSADHGQLPARSTTVRFNGNVLIQTADANLQRPRIHAATLNINTEKSIASTEGQVDFVMDQQRISGMGLEYDIKNQKLRLHSQVYGKFLKITQ
jgi:hypothetical protein